MKKIISITIAIIIFTQQGVSAANSCLRPAAFAISKNAAKPHAQVTRALLNTSLEAFFTIIGKNQLLDAAEQKRLAKRMINHGDNEARETLILSNLGLVVSEAKKFQYASKRQHDLLDIIHMGVSGLIIAVDKYNPEQEKFSTYATWWIRQTILRNLTIESRDVRLPDYKYNQHVKVRKACEEEGLDLFTLTDDDIIFIARKVQLKAKDVRGIARFFLLESVSLNAFEAVWSGSEIEETIGPGFERLLVEQKDIVDEDAVVSEDAELVALIQMLESWILESGLNSSDNRGHYRYVLRQRIWPQVFEPEKAKKVRTFKQIAKAFGCSTTTIQNMEKRCFMLLCTAIILKARQGELSELTAALGKKVVSLVILRQVMSRRWKKEREDVKSACLLRVLPWLGVKGVRIKDGKHGLSELQLFVYSRRVVEAIKGVVTDGKDMNLTWEEFLDFLEIKNDFLDFYAKRYVLDISGKEVSTFRFLTAFQAAA